MLLFSKPHLLNLPTGDFKATKKYWNHRMLGVGRDLCGSSGSTPPPKQGHLQQDAQDLVQVGFEYLQRRKSEKY